MNHKFIEFVQFLRENKAYEKYKSYINLSTSELKKMTEDPYSYLVQAFIWAQTPEGVAYWVRLHDKWLNKLKDEKR